MMVNKNKGFTMVELMVAMAIIALLVVAVGSSSSLVARNQIRESVDELTSLIDRARVEALKGKDSSIEFQVENGTYLATLLLEGAEKEQVEKEQVDLNNRADIYYQLKGGSDTIIEDSFSLVFDRSTGGYIEPVDIDKLIFDNGTIRFEIDITATTGFYTVEEITK